MRKATERHATGRNKPDAVLENEFHQRQHFCGVEEWRSGQWPHVGSWAQREGGSGGIEGTGEQGRGWRGGGGGGGVEYSPKDEKE